MNRILIVSFLAIALVSCNGCSEQKKPQQSEVGNLEEHLIQANRNKLAQEMTEIKAFYLEQGWPMDSTQTGLYYWVYEQGEGELPVKGEHIELTYTLEEMGKGLIYSSETQGNIQFLLEESDQVPGLHQCLKLVNRGSKVKAILPSHLGYGFSGDRNKIQPNTILVYDFHFLDQ